MSLHTQKINEILPLLSPTRQRKNNRFKDTKAFYRCVSFLLDIPV